MEASDNWDGHPDHQHWDFPGPVRNVWKTWILRSVQVASALLIVGAWATTLQLTTQVFCVMVAITFACLEWSYNGITEKRPDGALVYAWWGVAWDAKHKRMRLTPPRPARRRPYTSWAQFIMNMLLSGWIVHYLWESIEWRALRLLLFPFLVWLLEVVQGYTLYYIWRMRVWQYDGRDAYFRGFIKTSHIKAWVPFGIFIEIVYPTVWETSVRTSQAIHTLWLWLS